MKKHLAALSCGLMLAGSVACGDVDDEPDEEVQGIQLAAGTYADNDVDEMKYKVYEADKTNGECPSTEELYPSDFTEDELVLEEQKPLKDDLRLPAGIPSFENSPFHEDSQHEFADLFAHVDAGCYFVYVQPKNRIDEETKIDSEKCLPTWGSVDVEPNEVTEEVLISQCEQQHAAGIMDIVAALNNPPKVDDANVEDNKFNECPAEGNPTETYCVTAVEPDKDPMNINWVLADDDGVIDDQVFFSTKFGEAEGTFHEIPGSGIIDAKLTKLEDNIVDGERRVRTECLEITFDRLEASTKYNFGVVVYDKLYGNDKLVTFEDYFAALGIVEIIEKVEDGEDVVASILSRDHQTLLKYIEECPDGGDLRECNRTMGYWKHLPDDTVVEARWSSLDDEDFLFEPFGDGAEALCGIDWIDILRTPAQYRNQYYNLARQYITAELNLAKYGVEDDTVDSDLLKQVNEVLTSFCSESPFPPSKSDLDTRVDNTVEGFDDAETLQQVLDDFNSTCPDQEQND